MARNVVFLNNPTPTDVQDIGRFVVEQTGKPVFSTLVLFAANINGKTAADPTLFYNDQMTQVLDGYLPLVQGLQAKGIKVQLSYLGNHESAGWSCTMSKATAIALADRMVHDVVKYGLDGINVDDEYSLCAGDTQSFYWVLEAIRAHPAFSGKVLSKAVWSDAQYFAAPHNVASLLDEGYEMSYGGSTGDLDRYVAYGMKKEKLFLGLSPERNSGSAVQAIATLVKAQGYAGVMVWAPNALLATKEDAIFYYTEILRAQEGPSTTVRYQSK